MSRSRVPVSASSTVPPSIVPVASTSNYSTSVAPAPVVVPAAAAAAVAAELPVATESLTAAVALIVAPTVAAKSVTAACTSMIVPRDIGYSLNIQMMNQMVWIRIPSIPFSLLRN